MAETTYTLKSAQFRREREASWRELESLLDQVDRDGLGSLSHDEINRLPELHRVATSSLSVARAISLDRNLLEYLANLACRAHLVVYAGRRQPRAALAAFFGARLPRLVRALRWPLLASYLILALGVWTGYAITSHDPERFHSFVPAALELGRGPSAPTDSLRAALYGGGHTGSDALGAFASFLFSHNAKAGLMCLFLGFAAGIPVAFVLFTNGLTLGAFVALYASRGLGLEFWAWVLPHGVSELSALALCGAAGFVFGASVVFPGRETRLRNLARRGRGAALVVVGAVMMLAVAAIFEGVFRQRVHDVGVRLATAAVVLAGWIAYYGFAGRRGEGARERDDRLDG